MQLDHSRKQIGPKRIVDPFVKDPTIKSKLLQIQQELELNILSG